MIHNPAMECMPREEMRKLRKDLLREGAFL